MLSFADIFTCPPDSRQHSEGHGEGFSTWAVERKRRNEREGLFWPFSLSPMSLFVQSGDRVRPEMSFGLHQPPSFTPLHPWAFRAFCREFRKSSPLKNQYNLGHFSSMRDILVVLIQYINILNLLYRTYRIHAAPCIGKGFIRQASLVRVLCRVWENERTVVGGRGKEGSLPFPLLLPFRRPNWRLGWLYSGPLWLHGSYSAAGAHLQSLQLPAALAE